MIVRNINDTPVLRQRAHGGDGEVANRFVFWHDDFETPLRFLIHAELAPGQSVGEHTHGADEEMYVILEGHGEMTVNGETRAVGPGDAILNRQFWTHGLRNTGAVPLKMLVFEIGMLGRAESDWRPQPRPE